MKWTKPNTITGSAAEGSKYFRRKDIEDKLWHEIVNYNHVLFLAPRRVGKSSIVMYMAQNNINSFSSKYENIQSDSSIQDFYYRMCTMSYDALSTYGKTKNWLSKWWNRWKITSVGKDKIDIKNVDIDYRQEFFDLLNDIQHQKEKVVLFLDEFPDVIWNIYNKSGSQDAETLLNDVRELRQTKSFKDVFIMVLLGSIGLSHIVKKISGRTDKVNDLHKEYLNALKPQKAQEFLEYLMVGATMQIDEETKTYILSKIGHFIPYYIQLIIEECDDILYDEKRKDLTKGDVNKAYSLLLKKHEHFQDWNDRLAKYFPEKYDFLLEVLSTCAKHEYLSIQEVFNIARAHNNLKEWKADVDDILIADGYLNEEEDKFCFNSPLLRDWWKSRHPLMEKQ